MTFSGGDYEEVARWLRNFVISHAKREDLRVEAVVETDRPREGKSFGVRLGLGEALYPPADQSPLELSFAEVASNRGSLLWCSALAGRVRELAHALSSARTGSPTSV